MDLLAHMQTFIRVVDGKSLSAAARSGHLSLPAVSRQLRALEEELGAQLVVRSTRSLRVTDAGRAFYAHALRVLQEVEFSRAAVADVGAVAGRLSVSASLTFGQLVLVPRLSALAKKHPRLSIDLRLEDQLVDLVGEGVDVAIRAGIQPPDSTAYIAHPLMRMRRVLVASPSHLRKRGAVREPEQLALGPCLVQLTLAGTVIPWRLRRSKATNSDGSGSRDDLRTIDVPGQLRSNAPLSLRDLAISGAGIAYLPDFVVDPEIAAGRLKRVLTDWRSDPVYAHAVHRTELRENPRVRALLAALAKDIPSR